MATELLQGDAQDVMTLTVPATPGLQDYLCTPHAQMMRGSIVVE